VLWEQFSPVLFTYWWKITGTPVALPLVEVQSSMPWHLFFQTTLTGTRSPSYLVTLLGRKLTTQPVDGFAGVYQHLN
jgi:hypothetical protein